jgi:hypothetical protein
MDFVLQAKDEEELQYFKDKTTKLKLILLEKKGKHPLQQIGLLTKRERDLFVKDLKHLWETMSDDDITAEFNSICCDRLFTEGVDVSAYGVRSVGVSEDDAQKQALEEQNKNIKIMPVEEGDEGELI